MHITGMFLKIRRWEKQSKKTVVPQTSQKLKTSKTNQ